MIRNKKLLASVVGALLLASCGGSGESASGDTSQERVKNAALTTVAPSCKSGGECRVGDTGPGGGTVFYVGTEKINSYGDKYPGGRYMEFLDSKENFRRAVARASMPRRSRNPGDSINRQRQSNRRSVT